MSDASSLALAKEVALGYLAAAARTESQVRSRLARAGLSAEADEVVGWLVGLGYVDDAAYARARAGAFVASGRVGPGLAERRLVVAGIERNAARAAVAAAMSDAGPGAEAVLCRALAERRARTADIASLHDGDRRRLARFLLGRGFSGTAVARTLGLYDDSTP